MRWNGTGGAGRHGTAWDGGRERTDGVLRGGGANYRSSALLFVVHEVGEVGWEHELPYPVEEHAHLRHGARGVAQGNYAWSCEGARTASA